MYIYTTLPQFQASAEMFVTVCLLYMAYPPTGWRNDHGPTIVRAMVKISLFKVDVANSDAEV